MLPPTSGALMKSLSKMNSNILFSLILAATVAVSGCSSGGGVQAKEAEKPNTNAVPVEVATVAHSPVSASYNGTATLVADHEAQVASKTTGVLVKLLVEEGMTVREGQLLAELDQPTIVGAEPGPSAIELGPITRCAAQVSEHIEDAVRARVGRVGRAAGARRDDYTA